MTEKAKAPVLKQVKAIRKFTVATFAVGGDPAPQVRDTHEAGDLIEVPETLAISMVRGKQAVFTAKGAQETFEASEKERISNGIWLNDAEQRAWMKTQEIAVQQLA